MANVPEIPAAGARGALDQGQRNSDGEEEARWRQKRAWKDSALEEEGQAVVATDEGRGDGDWASTFSKGQAEAIFQHFGGLEWLRKRRRRPQPRPRPYVKQCE